MARSNVRITMKVVHIIHYCYGGIVTVVMNQLMFSQRTDIEYHVVVFERCDRLITYMDTAKAGYHFLEGNMLHKLLQLGRLLRKLQPNVIHTHSYLPRLFMGIWCIVLDLGRVKQVTTVHNDYPYLHGRNFMSRFKRCSEGWVLRWYNDATICVSKRVAQTVQDCYHIDKYQICWIPNGVVIPEMTDASKREHTENAKDIVIVITVGRLSDQKNYRALLDCWRSVTHLSTDAVLWFVGDGEERDMLQEHTRQLGLEDKVKFWGWWEPSAVFDLLSQADVFVLSSRYEGFGMVILEAAGMGLPVVSTDVADVRDIVEDGCSGYVVADMQEMEHALVRLIESKRLRQEMGACGRRHVLAQYTVGRYVTQVEALYETCDVRD